MKLYKKKIGKKKNGASSYFLKLFLKTVFKNTDNIILVFFENYFYTLDLVFFVFFMFFLTVNQTWSYYLFSFFSFLE